MDSSGPSVAAQTHGLWKSTYSPPSGTGVSPAPPSEEARSGGRGRVPISWGGVAVAAMISVLVAGVVSASAALTTTALLLVLAGGVAMWGVDARRRRSMESELATHHAYVCHEIRNPGTGLRALVDILAQTRLSEEQAELVYCMRQCCDSMTHVLDDVVDSGGTSIRSGRQLAVRPTATRMAALIRAVDSVHRENAWSLRLRWSIDVGPRVPRCVLIDGSRVCQVLHNLVGNALKHTEPGDRVTLRVRVQSVSELATNDPPPAGDQTEDPDTGAIRLLFEVEDSGSGIAPDLLPRIFEPFTRFGQTPGAGLGLSLVRTIMTCMGGTVSVSSSPGVGSLFTVGLPLSRVQRTEEELAERVVRATAVHWPGCKWVRHTPIASPSRLVDDYLEPPPSPDRVAAGCCTDEEVEEPPQPPPVRVLVLEEDLGNRHLAHRLLAAAAAQLPHLTGRELRIELMSDPVPAVRAAGVSGELAACPGFGLVLLDARLGRDPVAGLDTVRSLRALPAFDAVIIVVTDTTDSALVTACLKSGADLVMRKPYDLGKMKRALSMAYPALDYDQLFDGGAISPPRRRSRSQGGAAASHVPGPYATAYA